MIEIDIAKLNPSKVNDLTEMAQTGYKLYSTNLIDLYNGLHPASLSKIAHILFSCVLTNKIYKKPDAKGYSDDESKRIFTSILVQPKDLAKRINPVKYLDVENDIENDISNILKRLDELEEQNIFYMWRLKSPSTYIFVMERDASSWKYYNPNGYIYPKSLKKIVRLAKSMIETMMHLDKQRNRKTTRIEVENSYGEFINKLICKMNPVVCEKLTKWNEGINIFSYTSCLLGELRQMADFEGCTYDKMFANRLPEHIRNKIIKLNKEVVVNIDALTLENDLVPSNGNLVKAKSTRSRSPKTANIEPLKAELHEVKRCDPFKNPTELTKYYRSLLRVYNSETRFYDFSSEVILAGDVLDTLIKNGRNNNIKFLNAWIRFYSINGLKGNNIFKEEKTSIRAIGQTFDSYNMSYIG
jgi:hypothetical protein